MIPCLACGGVMRKQEMTPVVSGQPPTPYERCEDCGFFLCAAPSAPISGSALVTVNGARLPDVRSLTP